MTTQLPNGYEAVKVPEGGRGVFFGIWKGVFFCDVNGVMFKTNLFKSGKYVVMGNANNFTESEARLIVAGFADRYWFDYVNPSVGGWAPGYTLFTALESFRSLLASIHLEPHTTIILKKENV